MRIRTIYLDILAALFITLLVASCSDSPTNSPPDNSTDTTDTTDTLDTNKATAPAPPTGLQIVSLDGGVDLKWTPSVTGGVEYEVTFTDGVLEQSSTSITSTFVGVSDLTNGVVYTFSVRAVKDGKESAPATIMGAPATRAIVDEIRGGVLRIYHRTSVGKGSGIVITATGAYNASVGPTSPDLPRIQLVGDILNGEFMIGAPQSFTHFSQVNNFRTDVQISDAPITLNLFEGLDSWYMNTSLESLFGSGSKKNFTIQDNQGDNVIGFAIRWGTPGMYRYARVAVIPGANGRFIQTDQDGDQYIEIRISYNYTPGVPFA